MFILLWHDVIEIVFFIFVVYRIALFLQHDKQKNLVGYLYGYLVLLALTHFFQFSALYSLLLFSLPVISVLFIVFHQQQLQKNFISLQRIGQNLAVDHVDWHDIIIRGFLYALNKNKMMVCAFERNDALCLESVVQIDALISLELLSLIVDSTQYDQEKMVWISKRRILSFNAIAQWDKKMFSFDQDAQQMPLWVQDALLITAKTDAIFLGIDNRSRTFSIIAQGKLLEKINSETALRLLRSYYNNTIESKDSYEYVSGKRSNFKQFHH